jgi:hypothetical protein
VGYLHFRLLLALLHLFAKALSLATNLKQHNKKSHTPQHRAYRADDESSTRLYNYGELLGLVLP